MDSRSTKKPTINVPNYTVKANNVEFNPLTWLWRRSCGGAAHRRLCLDLLGNCSSLQQEYSKLVEITFCLAPPSINPCLWSHLMLTNNNSVCDVSWLRALVDARRLQPIFKLHSSSAAAADADWKRHQRITLVTGRFIWTSVGFENCSVSEHMRTCKYVHGVWELALSAHSWAMQLVDSWYFHWISSWGVTSEPAVQSETERRFMVTITALYAVPNVKGQSLLLICLYLTNLHRRCSGLISFFFFSLNLLSRCWCSCSAQIE